MDQNSKEKKLFFFGQPGCLKVKFDIPIRPSENSDSQSDDNEIGEKNNSEGTSENTLIDDKNTTKKAENSSDEDGAELLKKIDAVLEVKNDHQNEDNSENLSNETIKETPINDASNNHIDEVSTETIQKETNNIEIQSCETSTNEESQNKCEEKSALEIASSANTETITEKIENVYNVKSVDNNIEVDDENNLAIDVCKSINLKSEEISSKSLDLVDEKLEETEKVFDELVKPNESLQNVEDICKSNENIEEMESEAPNESSLEEKNLEKEENSLNEVENVKIKSSSEISVDEKSHEEINEKIIEITDENKEKEMHSENLASELSDNQIETCEDSVKNEAIEPVICASVQNDSKSIEQTSSSIITEEISQTTHMKPQDVPDNSIAEKLLELQEDVAIRSQKSEIKVTESISEVSEEQVVCESDSKPSQEEIRISEVSNDENTCPSQEPQVLSNETSINNYEESVPKNDNLDHKGDKIDVKEETSQDDEKTINTPQEEQLTVTEAVENDESQIQETEPSKELNKTKDLEILETQKETQKDESLIEAENTITQNKEEDKQSDQTEENLCTEETEHIDEISAGFVKETSPSLEADKISKTKDKSNDDQASTSELFVENVNDDQALTSNLEVKENEDILITEQIVSNQESKEETELKSEDVTHVELPSSFKLDVEESKTIEPNSEDVVNAQISERIEEPKSHSIEYIVEKSELVDQDQNNGSSSKDIKQSKQESLNLEELQIANIDFGKSESKEVINVEKEQDKCPLTKSEKFEKEKISESIKKQNVDKISEASEILIGEVMDSTNQNNIQQPESMEIENSEEINQDYSANNKNQIVEEPNLVEVEEVMEINDQDTDVRNEGYTENIPANISNMQGEVACEKDLEIEQIEAKSVISFQVENLEKEEQIVVQPVEKSEATKIQEIKETIKQYEEVQQHVVSLESNEEKDITIEEGNATEIAIDDDVENVMNAKALEMPNIEVEDQKSAEKKTCFQNENKEIESSNVENLHSEKVEEKNTILEQQSEIPKIDDIIIKEDISLSDATVEVKQSCSNEDNPVKNKFISKEKVLEANETTESKSINEDKSILDKVIETIPDKGHVAGNLNNKITIDPEEKIEKSIEEEINIESQSIQEDLHNENDPKEYISAIVENKETPQEEVSDKPEVLSEMPKVSFEVEHKSEKLLVEAQPVESITIDESLKQNIDNVTFPPVCIDSDDSQPLEINVSDKKEPQKFVDLKDNQKSKIEIEYKNDSLVSTDPINDESESKVEIEIIPQESITVKENSNEKINDNQVELSKSDNKSSSLEKVSPLEVIKIQNDISEDLNKTNTKLIEEEKNTDEVSSIAQVDKDIQPQLDENFDNQHIEEKKVELETEKQYGQTTERHTEGNLTDKSNDEKCKEDINIEISKKVVENLTEKIILNEMPVKEVCKDNNQDNNEPKEPIESDSKCNETVTPPTKEIAINVENNNQLALKEPTEILDDKPTLEDSGSKEIINMDVLQDSEPEVSSSDIKPIAADVLVKHVDLEVDDKSYLEDSDSKEILSIDTLKAFDKEVDSSDKKQIAETVLVKSVELPSKICETKIVDEKREQPPVDPLEISVEATPSNTFDDLLDKETKLESIPITKSFQKPVSTRKRKMSERKSISESDSDGGSHFVTDSVSNEKSSDEETVATKKPRIRNKITATRNTRATRQSARVSDEAKLSPEVKVKEQKKSEIEEKKDEEKTIQNFKFDYDENEDIASKMAAIKTLICKEPRKKIEDDVDDDSNESSAEESSKKKPMRKGRKSKRGRTGKKNDAQESSSDDSKSAKLPDSKRSKTSESEETTVEKQSRKKRDSAGKGLLKYIDTSLVIETVETEAPIRQSRRIAQQKIREETERRQMEEKMLKQMKAEAEKKKKMASIPEPPDDENDHSSDESYKDSTRKKKTKIKASDKQWQTSSSHSENSESEDEFERPPSEDPGSPLFRSDHEFSPESDVDEAPAQPVKRARTAKKQVEESSDEEDINPIHACQVCHKTDCPEWILLCDECDHGYHCSCLKPIIFCIPSGNWYCPLCCHKKLVDDLSVQLENLDTLIVNIKAEEIRHQKQLEIKKLAEITEENILNDKRKKRSEINAKEEKSRGSKTRDRSSDEESGSNGDESSENSSDNEPLNEIFYKLRRRNQTMTSYRFNDYDDLINSAIKRDMDEVKGMGNAGRGKDISTIIEADKEEKKLQKMEQEKDIDEKNEKPSDHQEGEESSGSDIVRSKKAIQRKKKNRKLNNLDATSEEDQASDEDFKGTPSTNSDTEEEYSASSNDVSESSLDLPLKKGKRGQRSTRSAAKNRRYDETFIDDNSSDDEPLIKKRIKKQVDSDEEEFDVNEENSDGSTPDDIDSEDLCDDTESDDSSESNWPKKKKKRNASYDIKKPRKQPKKTGDGGKDKAFRAGISKKKILKVSDNESEASDESDKGRRKTRGKKLLYLIEDDYESDDGIKPGIGVVRPETPPEERELFVKKQEEIKRMLAEKNTEAARQLAVPTIEPIKFALERPESPIPPPLTSDELASLSTIPKNVIEGAKALDMDYNKIKPIHFGVHTKSSEHPSAHDMSEEDLARMMEEEDFAQHQLKMVGETINRNKLLELEVKEEAFASIGKGGKIKDDKEHEKVAPPETKKRARKPKQEKQTGELSSPPAKIMQTEAASQKGPSTQHIAQSNVPISVASTLPHSHEPTKPHSQNIPSVPPLISNPVPHQSYPTLPPRYPGPHHLNIQDRPSVLSNYLPRHEGMPPNLEGMRPRLENMPGMPPRLGMQPRLEGMLSRLEVMGPRIQGMPSRFEGMGPRLEGLPPRLEGMGPRLEGITSRLEGMTARLEVGSPHQHALRFPHQPPEGFSLKSPPIAPQLPPQSINEEGEEKKKGRRKKYTPLRTDLVDSNASKVAKLETPTTSSVIHSTLNLSTERPDDKSKVSLPPLQRVKPEVFNPATSSSSSVITRLLQPQQRPQFGGFVEQINVPVTSANNPNAPTNPRAFPEDMKHLPIGKQVRPGGPQGQFPENPFVPRGMHTLYRGPPTTQPSIYGIPSHHARIPYPFHLHPNNNLRPNMQEYGAPYNIPPQFGYYAPPAHSRQHPPNTAAPPLSHQEHPDIPPNNARPNNNVNPNDEPSESSEFGGLVSYFSSQQELD